MPPNGGLALSPSTIAFTDPGQTAAITAGEQAYSGPVSVSATACGSIVTVAPPSSTSSPAQFTVTAQAPGACTLSFTDQFGRTAALAIGVTVTKGTIQ